jgi:hypothetical protein
MRESEKLQESFLMRRWTVLVSPQDTKRFLGFGPVPLLSRSRKASYFWRHPSKRAWRNGLMYLPSRWLDAVRRRQQRN